MKPSPDNIQELYLQSLAKLGINENRRLTEGDGVTAEALKAHGITIYGESDVEKL